MVSRRRFLLAPVGALAALAVGPTLSARARTTVKIATAAVPPSIHGIWLHVAYELGFFQRNGIDVAEFIQLRGGPLAMQAVASRHVDIAPADPEGVLSAALAGHPIRALAAPGAELAYFLALRKELRSIKDLGGRSFAISRPGAISHYLMFPLLERARVARDSVQWVGVGGGYERMLALLSNRVQGALLNVDFAMEMTGHPDVTVVQSVSDVVRGYPAELLVVRKDLVDENPEAATAITRAVIEACRHIVRDKAHTIGVALKYAPGMNAAVLSRAYDELIRIGGFGVNGGLTEANLKVAHDLALKNGQIARPVRLDEWVDLRFQQRALDSLGRFTP
jgi:NitT/TauT family transport system substrate-binding protein